MQTTQTAHGLSLLLGDVDPARFFAEHWGRRSLHLRHGDPSRVAHLISAERFLETETRRCVHLKASARDRDGWNHEIRIQPEQAPKLFRTGMTICATMLDPAGPCGALIDAYRGAVVSAIPPHVNCYYSPDGAGYGLHFDTHPVWIVQVEGRKHWTVGYEPAVRNPSFNVLFPPGRDRVTLPWITLDRPDVDDPRRFMHVCLEPGDVLYLPAGCWHAARADGYSLALTLASDPMPAADLFATLLQQAVARSGLAATERLSPFPKEDVAGDGAEADLRAQVTAALEHVKQTVNRLQADDVMALYAHLAAHPELFARRQFADAAQQVQAMKARQAADGR